MANKGGWWKQRPKGCRPVHRKMRLLWSWEEWIKKKKKGGMLPKTVIKTHANGCFPMHSIIFFNFCFHPLGLFSPPSYSILFLFSLNSFFTFSACLCRNFCRCLFQLAASWIFFFLFLINYFNSIFVKIKIWKSNILDLIIIFIYFYVIYNFLYKSFLTFFPRQNFCSASCSNISSTHLFFISLALSS